MNKLLTTEDLALILCKSVSSVRQDITRNPSSLPPRIVIPGNKRGLWRPKDVETWLEAHVQEPISIARHTAVKKQKIIKPIKGNGRTPKPARTKSTR